MYREFLHANTVKSAGTSALLHNPTITCECLLSSSPDLDLDLAQTSAHASLADSSFLPFSSYYLREFFSFACCTSSTPPFPRPPARQTSNQPPLAADTHRHGAH